MTWRVFLLVVTLSLLACTDDIPLSVGYVDLLDRAEVTKGRLGAPLRAQCGEETRWARPLYPGTELSVEMVLEEDATLLVSTCTDLPGTRENGDRLVVEVTTWQFEERVGVASEGSRHWSQAEQPLAARGRVELKVRAELPTGPVYLRDLTVRHRRPRPDAPAEPPPQILMISLDTFRYDAIAAFGGEWPTPNLDALIAESEVWERSWATGGWTKPSHGSLWTGHAPLVHGTVDYESVLNPAVPTVAERLQRAGFRTAALMDFVYLDERFGFARGFGTFYADDRNLEQQNRWLSGWMRRNREEPFFAVLHTFETHSDSYVLPYESPEMRQKRVDTRFGTDGYGCTGEDLCATKRLVAIRDHQLEPLPNEAEILRFLYGASVSYLDQRLGELFDDLRALGVWDDLTLIVTADHGEAFFENGHLTHGRFWEPVLRVPLIVKWPGGEKAGSRQTVPVSGLDVVPTILAAAGLPHDDLPGADLATLRRIRPLFLGSYGQVVVDDEWKLIDDAGTSTLGLFHLGEDPGELEDLSEERPEVLARLEEMRRDFVRREQQRAARLGHRGKESPLDEDERARLRSLGYVD